MVDSSKSSLYRLCQNLWVTWEEKMFCERDGCLFSVFIVV